MEPGDEAKKRGGGDGNSSKVILIIPTPRWKIGSVDLFSRVLFLVSCARELLKNSWRHVFFVDFDLASKILKGVPFPL